MTKKPLEPSIPEQEKAEEKPDVFVVVNFQLDDLHLDQKNARMHNEESLQAIKMSLERFGQQKPIVVDKNNKIVSGNGTVMAARALGWSGIDAIVTDLTGDEAVAFAISDNRTSEMSMWDGAELSAQLEYLSFDYGTFFHGLGFNDQMLEELGALGQVAESPLIEPMAQSKTPEEYNTSTIRQILFLLEEELYVRVTTKMDEVMALQGLKTHAEVLLHLLEIEKYEHD